MDDIDEIATVTAGAEFHANFKTSPGKFLRCGPFRSGPALDESLFSITDKSEARLLGVPKTTYGR